MDPFQRDVEEILAGRKPQVPLDLRKELPQRMEALEVRVANIEQALRAIVVELAHFRKPTSAPPRGSDDPV